jgi:hypothetical protein
MNALINNTQLMYTNQEQLLLNARSARPEYFTRIQWQYFTTHFITRPSTNAHRRSIWHEYLDRIRALHRDTLAYLWAEESRSAHGDQYRIPVHFHALWSSHRQLDTSMMATQWQALAGNGGRPFDIKPYNPSGEALAYILKLADRSDCHWDFSNNLSLFLPEPVDLSTCQGRRRYKRHLARANSVLTAPSLENAIGAFSDAEPQPLQTSP